MRTRLSDIANMLPRAAAKESPARSYADMLSGVAQGDLSSNAALYEVLCPVVLRTLQKVLRDPAIDYDDLVQTTFEQIVRALVREDAPHVSNLPAWAGAVATHVALDALRSKIRERKIFQREDATQDAAHSAVASNVENEVEARRKLAWVQETLAHMNQAQAETLLLHDVFGHELVEIADITGVSVAASQKRLWRGRQELLQRAERNARGDKP